MSASDERDEVARRVIFNLPNILTIFRILALPFCAWALIAEDGENPELRTLSFALFFVVAMTDVLDGRLARASNQITDFGELWDPIADKALIATALISLNYLGVLPIWVTLVILGRELAVTLLRLSVLKGGVIPASKSGKAKALTQNISVGLYILPLPAILDIPKALLLGVALILTITSGYQYFAAAFSKRS